MRSRRAELNYERRLLAGLKRTALYKKAAPIHAPAYWTGHEADPYIPLPSLWGRFWRWVGFEWRER